jgi:UDP:flavonoid glycosyltransferase YjiC (YdhE family)
MDDPPGLGETAPLNLRYGLVAPPTIGHLNPMVALGMELLRRGHGVVVFTVADGAKKLAGLPLEVVTIGSGPFPRGAVEEAFATLGRLSGMEGLRYSVDYFRREQAMVLAELPEAVAAAGIDVLLVDQLCPAAGTVAEELSLPFITICNALPVNREAAVPPYFTGWRPSRWPWGRWRNQLGNALLDRLTEPLWRDLQDQRKALGLVPHRRRDEAASPLLQLAQLPQAFDFPRERLAAQFHYVGRLADPSGQEPLLRDAVPFPWEQLDGRPLIYASPGTLQNGRPDIFEEIAGSLRPGGGPAGDLPGQSPEPAVGAPRQTPGGGLCPPSTADRTGQSGITHAGLNTTLTALGAGVPVLAIPITNEQPGIAARLATCGAGTVLPLKRLRAATLQSLVEECSPTPAIESRPSACRRRTRPLGAWARRRIWC